MLLLALWLALALGPVSLPLGDTLRALLHMAGLPVRAEGLEQAELIVGQLRLPRALTGAAVGALLALCGVAMQGLFRNPLADPAWSECLAAPRLGRPWPSCSAPPWVVCRHPLAPICCLSVPLSAASP